MGCDDTNKIYLSEVISISWYWLGVYLIGISVHRNDNPVNNDPNNHTIYPCQK